MQWLSILGQLGMKKSFKAALLHTCQKTLCLMRGCHISHHPFVSNTCCTCPFCPPELWRLIWVNLRLVVPESACQSSGEDRWHAEINNLTQHHPFSEQMNLLWQYVYERSGDLLSSHLNILPSLPQAPCYLWQLGPALLCALMFNSRTHNQAGRRAWVCWELTRTQELRNSDFLQIFPVFLTLISDFAAAELLQVGLECLKMICVWPGWAP